ncbi:hypothetical protein DFH09DRAFT_1374027 [Mycena vulgaris]|nr:hypothetical protein DFH09DRAFT_1374027 [Mycena vulgaris]
MSALINQPDPIPSSSKLPRRAPSDVFRPRLPLDPFSPAPAHGHGHAPALPPVDPDAPWPARDLPALTHAFSQGPHVLLVLGAPSPHALAPLLSSPTFAQSLLLFVTHAPPPFPPPSSTPPGPAIRILRLRAALAPSAPAFALTLVAVLDAAAAVARAWRAAPGPPGEILQLAQDPHGAFAVAEPLAPAAPLPASEHVHPAGSYTSAPPRRSHLSPASSAAALPGASPYRLQAPKIKTHVDGTRAFDALLSFLPPAQPERAVLKHVVLVSTLAGAFLAGPATRAHVHAHSATSSPSGSLRGFDWSSAPTTPSYAHGPDGADSRPGSTISLSRPPSPAPSFLARAFGSKTSLHSQSVPVSRRASGVYAPAPPTRAHIVHVLPAAYRAGKLTAALSAFLASYSPSHDGGGGGARAYVLAERALRDVESVLVGALDGDAGGRGRGAWVAGVVPCVEGEAAADSPPGSAEDGEQERERVVDLTLTLTEKERERERDGERERPWGLPTPPASRSGSDEGRERERERELGAASASISGGHARTPSTAHVRTLSTSASAPAPTSFTSSTSTPTPTPTLTRKPSGAAGLPPGAAPPGKLRRPRRSGSISEGAGAGMCRIADVLWEADFVFCAFCVWADDFLICPAVRLWAPAVLLRASNPVRVRPALRLHHVRARAPARRQRARARRGRAARREAAAELFFAGEEWGWGWAGAGKELAGFEGVGGEAGGRGGGRGRGRGRIGARAREGGEGREEGAGAEVVGVLGVGALDALGFPVARRARRARASCTLLSPSPSTPSSASVRIHTHMPMHIVLYHRRDDGADIRSILFIPSSLLISSISRLISFIYFVFYFRHS